MNPPAGSTLPLRTWRPVLVVLLLVVFAGDLAAAQPVVDRPPTYQGTLEDGSLYAIWMPAEWNGSLVLYAHGIVEPFRPVAIPTTQDNFYVYRDGWLDRHFAVAASSYAENGWALGSAVESTHQLRGVFREVAGIPDRTFLVGHSLGSLAVAKLVEKHGDQYEGAMPICGVLGGAQLQIEYGRDGRLLFDYFFPGVLPGTVFDVPALTPMQIGTLTQGAAQAAAAGFVTGNPAQQAKTIQWLRTSGAPVLPFGPPYPANLTVASIATSAGYAAGFSLTFTNDLLARVNNRIPVDNTNTEYAGSFDDELLNATIARYDDEQPAVAYFRRLYETTGRIRTKVLSLHTRWDPAVPAFHEAAYAVKVAEAGRSDQLVQRIYPAYGHCDPEMFGTAPYDPAFIAATLADFDSLVTWASGGPRPAPLP